MVKLMVIIWFKDIGGMPMATDLTGKKKSPARQHHSNLGI